jgi:hypothetical protein
MVAAGGFAPQQLLFFGLFKEIDMEDIDLVMDYCEDCKKAHPVACIECCATDDDTDPVMLCPTHARARHSKPTATQLSTIHVT